MSIEWQIALFTGIGGILCALIVFCGVGFLKLYGMITDVRERIVKMEVTLEIIGRKSAKMLHSPHDPWGLDPMLDKYLDRHYEMTFEEWKELLARCEVIAEDKTIVKEERFIAAQLAAVCWHKLGMRPPERKQVEKRANIAEDVTAEIVSEK